MIDIKNRVQGLRFVRAGDLVPNPRNPRIHPDEQMATLTDALEELGFAGVILARPITEADGALWAGTLGEEKSGRSASPADSEKLSRRCAAIEIDPGYAAVILDRMLGMGCEPRMVAETTEE